MAERTVAVALQAKISNFVANWRAAGREVGAFNDKLQKGALKNKQHLDKLTSGVGLVGLGMVGAAGLAVKKFADFDQAMSAVAATGADAKGSIDALRQAALDAGADTKYSATEAAGGIESLEKAGVSAKDIIAGGLKGALDLAAAGNLNVADSADVAATAMTQFNLTGKDVPHIADLLAAGAGKAQGEVSDMAMALKQSGLVASQFGLSIEETTGTLAAFASAGLIGSDAGTSFKTMLIALANPSTKAQDVLDKYNITMYDAQGNFVGMSNLAGQLHDKLGKLDPATRNAALAQIFGNDAIRAANVLYKQGAQGIDNWIKKVNEAGYAHEVAGEKMNNLAGDIEQFYGALENALVGVGEGGNGPLRSLVQDATAVVKVFQSMPDPIQQATLAIVGGGGLVLLGIAGLGRLIVKIGETKVALEGIGITATRVGAMMKFVGVIGAITAIGGIVDWASDKFHGLDANVDDVAKSMEGFSKTGKYVGDAAKLANNGVSDLNYSLQVLGNPKWYIAPANWVDKYIYPLSGQFDDASKTVSQFDQALAQLAESSPKDAKAIFEDITKRAREQGVPMKTLKELFPQYAEAVKNAGKENEGAAPKIKKTGDEAGDQAPKVSEAAEKLKAMKDQASGLDEALQLLNTTMGVVDSQAAAEDAYDRVQERLKEYRKQIKKADSETKGMKNAFDLSTQAGRDNFAAVEALWTTYSTLAVKTKEQTGSQKKANEVLATGRERLVEMATKFLGSKAAAEKYVTEILGIPPSVTTHIYAPGLTEAERKARLLKETADYLNGKKVSTQFIETHYEYRQITYGETSPGNRNYHTQPKKKGKAHGGLIGGLASGGVPDMFRTGLVVGPGSGTSDTAGLFALSNGEFVVKANAVKKNLDLLMAINGGLDIAGYKNGRQRPIQTAAPYVAASTAHTCNDGSHTYNFEMRSIDLNERNFHSVTHAARLRQRVGRPR